MLAKRLSDRLIKYWDLIRKDEPLPRFEKFNSEAVSDVWESCIIFKVNASSGKQNSYTFYKIGRKVRDLYDEDLTGNTLNPRQRMFKGADIIRRIDDIIQDPKPMQDNGQFISADNKVVKFRSCLLPFGNDNEVTHVVSGLSWREF